MSNRITPTATFLDDWRVELRFPYNAKLVDDLKDRIPASYRRWDPESKIWSIEAPEPKWAKTAADLLLWAFPYAQVIEVKPNRSPKRHETDTDFQTLHLLPSAPPALVRAARKVLSLECHPDRGGSHEAMVALNLAYERLEQRGCA